MVEQRVSAPAPPTDIPAQVMFELNKDGTLQFYVDYRCINDMTVRDASSIPRVDESIDSLGDGEIFSTLDTNSGYW